jgi:acyl-CoA thioesterase-2
VDAIADGSICQTMACSFTTRIGGTTRQSAPVSRVRPDDLGRVTGLGVRANDELYAGIDIRPIEPAGPASDRPGPPVQRFWLRILRSLPADPLLHACALAYVTDLGITHAGDRPQLAEPGVRKGASLDHGVWFHRALDANGWLLVEQDSPTYAHSRAFCRAQMFDADAALVASVAQEAMIRRTV